MNARRPALGPILTSDQRMCRPEYAQEHRDWRMREWKFLLFTDESRFHLSTCDGRVRVWRRWGKRYAECTFVETDRFGGGSFMVWGGVGLRGRMELHVMTAGTLTAVCYRDEILDPNLRSFAGAIGNNFISMQDNACLHMARLVMDYLYH